MNHELLEKISHDYPTPMYVFDIKKLKERVAYLKSKLPERITLCYAIKANTFIVGKINDCIGRFEVCSPGELCICREMNIPQKKIVVSGVYKTPEIMEEYVKSHADVFCYTIESMIQFELFAKLAEKHGVKLPIMLRLTSGSQFGINEDEIKTIVRNYSDSKLVKIVGIQYFSGTQKTSLKRMKRELDYVDTFMQALTEETGFKVSELEFGPGFPVNYFQADSFDEDSYLHEFSEIINSMTYKTEITLELGRSIAASCGNYLTSVVDMKTNKKENYAVTDGGMHQLVYYGQSMAMRHPYYELLPKKDSGEEKLWNVCGSLCTVNDILVKQMPLKDLKIGDVISFENTGAYCMTEGISLFLSRDLPHVILLNEDGTQTVARDAVQIYKLNKPKTERD